MPEQPTEPPVNDGDNRSSGKSPLIDGRFCLVQGGITTLGCVPQASAEARLPPLRKRPFAKNTSGQGDGAKREDQ